MRRVSTKISVLIISILSFVNLAQADSSNIESSFDGYETRKLIEKSEPIFECSLPPENAKGEIIINGSGEYSRSYYCY